MLGSYGPAKEPYTKNFDPEVSPSGMVVRTGSYHVRSRVVDDDGEVYAGMFLSFHRCGCSLQCRLGMVLQTRQGMVIGHAEAFTFYFEQLFPAMYFSHLFQVIHVSIVAVTKDSYISTLS